MSKLISPPGRKDEYDHYDDEHDGDYDAHDLGRVVRVGDGGGRPLGLGVLVPSRVGADLEAVRGPGLKRTVAVAGLVWKTETEFARAFRMEQYGTIQ